MSNISINKISFVQDNNNFQSVSYNYLGRKIYSSSKIDRITGVFTSNIIDATTNFIAWEKVIWTGIQTNYNIALYIKNSDSIQDMNKESWKGPFYNKEVDLSSFDMSYLQFMFVMVYDGVTNPQIDSIDIKFISSQDPVHFYTKLFDLGFSPKTILLTYNAEDTIDSVVRFAVSVQDTTDIKKYQFIEPNKIETLLNLSPLASKLKLMIEIIGDSGIPVKIHEVALQVGGDGAARLSKS